jgi:hypothetical protein
MVGAGSVLQCRSDGVVAKTAFRKDATTRAVTVGGESGTGDIR